MYIYISDENTKDMLHICACILCVVRRKKLSHHHEGEIIQYNSTNTAAEEKKYAKTDTDLSAPFI